MRMLFCGVSLACVTLFSASSLTAQTPKWALDGAAFSATPAVIQSAAAAIKAEPLMDVTVLFEQERYTLLADGRTVQTHQMLYRIEDKEGVEEWNQTSVEWDPWYQERPSIKARVIGADGKVSELDAKTLTDVPAKNESEDTFSDERVYKGPLPGVAVGSIVEEETVVTDKSPFFAGGGIYRTYFSRGVPVERSRLVVEVPEGVELKTKAHMLPESAVTKIEQAGKVKVYSYDLSPVPMLGNSDIQLATDKPRSVFVEVATGASWADVAAAYRKLSDGQIQPEQVKSLVAGLPTGDSMATIAALVAKLHKEIRYTGIEFGESALKPQTPGEVLKRHYGDCKDKAALLVGMLRASGIPAELALLSTGPGYDVGAELAGMNQFNHAIVHVPAGKNGRQELWIDATAEFTKVGDLPYPDQGRMALLIAEGTTGLTQIPEAKSADSVDVETREFELKQFGPARVVETSNTTGHIDADYRYRYGGTETKSTKEDLEAYAKRFYNAKALTHTEHTDGSDLTKPFVLKLVMDKASRGSTELDGAAVGIPPAGTMSMLPRWFFDDSESDETRLTDEQKADLAKAKLQRTDEYEVQPYISEMRYRVVAPEGFVPRALPEDQTLHMGPAVMTRHFEIEKNGPGETAGKQVVTAVIRFDTVKPKYTVDEALALKKAALEQNKLQYILLQFDQVGVKAIAEGKVRDGLAADRALIKAHPDASPEDAAMHHVQLSAALLGVGLGEEARKEARRATELDPKLQVAWLQLGVALENNDIGIRFGRGFDRKGALEAYRKASELDAENIYPVIDLAVLSEYNDDGERYAAGSNLADAVKGYRTLKTINPNSAESYEDSLLFALLYDRKYEDVLAELKTLPMNATRDAMAVAATAAAGNKGEGDAAAGLKRADLVAGGDEQKSAALRLAGLELIRLERYALAAEMLKAATAGQADSPQVQQQIAIFGNLKHADTTPLPATDPKAPAHLMMTSMMTGTMMKELPNFLDRNAYATEKEWQQNIKHNAGAAGLMRTMAAQAQLPIAVMRDVVLSNAKFNATGDDAKGYRVTMTALGAAPQSLFVTKDDGQYRIVASGTDNLEVGNYALYLLAHGREAEARNLLDWKRELVHKGGGDDALEGPLFPRFWTTGTSSTANAGVDAIKIAALALTISSQTPIEPALAASKTASGTRATDLELLLARAYLNRQDYKAAEGYTDKLLQEYPDSATAIALAGRVYLETGDYKAWTAMLKTRLDAKAEDHDLLEQAAEEAEAEQAFGRARADLQQILDAGKATSNDYNAYGWLGLFDDHLDQKTIEAAQQANQLTKSSNFGVMHTLACLYAAEGKTAEARQLLLAAMAARNESEPSEEVWFGLGLTYEQFGEKEAAIAAYKRVEKPEKGMESPVATYVLAQKHLKGLGA